jgi:hypothetical protein
VNVATSSSIIGESVARVDMERPLQRQIPEPLQVNIVEAVVPAIPGPMLNLVGAPGRSLANSQLNSTSMQRPVHWTASAEQAMAELARTENASGSTPGASTHRKKMSC